MAEADLSKIVSAIMGNPALIEEIKNTITGSDCKEDEVTQRENERTENTRDALRSETIPEESAYPKSRSTKRNEFLRAIRPYLSEERGRAIETMITVADILFAVREK